MTVQSDESGRSVIKFRVIRVNIKSGTRRENNKLAGFLVKALIFCTSQTSRYNVFDIMRQIGPLIMASPLSAGQELREKQSGK